MRVRRARVLLVATSLAVGVAAVLSCSSTPSPAGLLLYMRTDLKSTEYDDLDVDILQQASGGAWNTVLSLTRSVPREVTLPTSLFIESGTSADQLVDVRITASQGGTVVVEREAEIEVPTDRVALLDFFLAEVCRGVSCKAGETCEPIGAKAGSCASDQVSASGLPTFESGESFDGGGGGMEAAVTLGDSSVHEGGGRDVASDTGIDRTVSREAGRDVELDDASEAESTEDSGTDGGSDASGSPDSGEDEVSPDASVDGRNDASAPEAGPCTENTQMCEDGGIVATCLASGQWGTPWPCATGTCSEGGCTGSTATAVSCTGGGAGLNTCPAGTGTESCCTSLEVPGGTFYRTYNTGSSLTEPPDGGWPDLADPATVSGFRLDKYDVTVGRFRRFVTAWNGSANNVYPTAGQGKHAHLNGGNGLVNSLTQLSDGGVVSYETGWDAVDWNNAADIDPTDTSTNLECQSPYNSWTDPPTGLESLPMSCVNWWEAYAFCIWDGGFLPTAAEWEYAAAGGSQQRLFPWGPMALGTNDEYAIYGCYYPSGADGTCSGVENLAPVGSAPSGAGRWGQLDLAGNMFEWNLDGYVPTYVDPCIDCGYLPASTSGRTYRDGSFGARSAMFLLPSYYGNGGPTIRADDFGFRCARSP